MLIIILDDDSLTCFIHKKFFRMAYPQLNPISFTNPKEALKYIKDETSKEEIHLFLDLNMPVMSGWDVLKYMEKYFRDKKIYTHIVTSSTVEAEKKDAFCYGSVQNYITKPISKEKILKLNLTALPDKYHEQN